MSSDALNPAEALVLLNPRKPQGRTAVKITLTALLMEGAIRIEQREKKGFLGRTRKVAHLNVAPEASRQLSAPAASIVEVVRAAEADGGKLSDVAKRAQKAYGSDLNGYQRAVVIPALAARGLVEERRQRMLGLIPVVRVQHTSAGEAEKMRLEKLVAEARKVPDYISSDVGKAAAVALALGSAILMVNELRPYYRQISDALRVADPSLLMAGSDAAWIGDLSGSFSGGDFDLATFDVGAFDALDASLSAFDASFDSGSGSDGGGDSGGAGAE